ncbi:MAG: tryptophan--tRNA ligase [Alphaproteobacteria bacterium]
MEHKRVLSGIQPTGFLHLGNYLGAISQWVNLQETHESLFCIVDLHAITIPQDPQNLKRWIREVAAMYIASGIDPNRCAIFQQSRVSAHSELAWLLGCGTPLGWLNRMTQFKEKAGKHREQASLGLYAYPVLMAADILVYQATHVPVGEDQKQHLELTRDLAQAFNHHYGTACFTLPEPLITGSATRVMSLRDGTAKMSKSDPSELSRIHLTDDDDTIALKIRKAKTDPEPIFENLEAMKDRPEALNLLRIFAALQKKSLADICHTYTGYSFSDFKKELTELLLTNLGPIRQRFFQIMEEPTILDHCLEQGQLKANSIAKENLQKVHEIMGL